MNLILHLARKDAPYLRWQLLLWTFLLVIQAALMASEMQSSPDGFFGRTVVHLVLNVSVLVVMGVITVQLVHSDPVVGSTAFWMTRPISRAGLFTSKLLFALLTLVGVPMAISGGLAVALGVGGGTVVPVVLTVLAWQLCVMAIVFFVASITTDFPRFLLVGAALVVGFTGVVRYVGLPLRDSALRGWSRSPMALVDTQFWVLLVLATVLCLLVALYQYIRMNLRRTVGLTIVAAPLLLVAFSVWPWDLLARPGTSVDRSVLDPASVALSLDSATKIQPQLMFHGYPRERPTVRLFGSFTCAGIPQGVFVEPVGVESRLRFRDGPDIVTKDESRLRSWNKLEALGSQDLMLHALGHGPWTSLSALQGHGLEPVLAEVPQAAYSEHAPGGGVYSAVVTLDAYRYRLWAALPLRPGASCQLNPGGAVVRAAVRVPGGVLDHYEVVLREVAVVNTASAASRMEGRYLLRNQARRQVVFPTTVTTPLAWNQMFFPLGHHLRVLHTVLYVLGGVVDDAWLAEADLVRIEPVYLGRFTAPLRVDNLVLPPAS